MRLTPAAMYERFQAADPAYDGRFFTGVETTGIYCLPSCHARKPRREHVHFFLTCTAAREAGFRACRKCRPEDFEKGTDHLLETVEAVVAEIRAHPASFEGATAVVRRSGFGTTRAFELFRQHYHRTPAELLSQARLRAARRMLLETDHPLTQVAADAGYGALSSFHEHFRARTGLSPQAYRKLPRSTRFEVHLAAGYPLAHLLRSLGRDPQSVNERLHGCRYEAALRVAGTPVKLRIDFGLEGQAIVNWVPGDGPHKGQPTVPLGPEVHRIVVGLLGLEQDASAFARLARKLGFRRLVDGREQLRLVQTPSVFDGLVWAIVGQQINLPFACLLKRRLFERAGTPIGEGLIAAPTPQAIAMLTAGELRTLQFSRQKADYLLAAAARIASGELDLEALAGFSATRAERTLLNLKGLGPWSVNYILMRALGHPDCVPLGDTGVTSGLQRLFALETRPDVDTTRRLIAVFSPYRSLATAHLWQLLQSPPTLPSASCSPASQS